MATKIPIEILPAEFDDREEDKNPEPEDVKAYEHADAMKVEQDKLEFPQQVLRNGGKPSDEREDWQKPPDCDPQYTAYWVDVYEGPRGIGYVVCYEMDKAGTLYQKHINYGPEKEREQDWTEVIPLEEPK